jgi:hypothetical protein
MPLSESVYTYVKKHFNVAFGAFLGKLCYIDFQKKKGVKTNIDGSENVDM